MDAQLRDIERRFDADPLDPEPARMLARLHLRQGGLLSGRRLDEWVEDLLARGQPARVHAAFAALNRAHPFSVLAVPTMLSRFGRGRTWREARGFIAARGRWSLPFLVEAMDQEDYMVRARALEALAALASLATPAFPLIERALSDRHAWVRHKAVEAVLDLGATAHPFLPRVRGWIRDEDKERGIRAVLAAAAIESGGRKPPLSLRPFLTAEDPLVRDRARLAILSLIDAYFFFSENDVTRLRRWLRAPSALGAFAVLYVFDRWGPIDNPRRVGGDLDRLAAIRAIEQEARERLRPDRLAEADRPLFAAFEEGGLRLG